jgi:hypothetical protein
MPNSKLVTTAGLTTRQGVLWARVRILAEDTPPPVAQAYPLPRPLRAWALSRRQGQSQACAAFWPPWVWRQADPAVLTERAQAVLRSVAAWEGVKGGGCRGWVGGLDSVPLIRSLTRFARVST